MNFLALLNSTRDEIARHNLNSRVVSVSVTRSISTLSKKPEATVALAVFDNEAELVAFGNDVLGDCRVERFGFENQVPYVFYRAFLDKGDYIFVVSLYARYGNTKSQVFSEPTVTTFSAQSRAK